MNFNNPNNTMEESINLSISPQNRSLEKVREMESKRGSMLIEFPKIIQEIDQEQQNSEPNTSSRNS